MHSKPYILQALKYATITIAGIIAVIAIVALTKNDTNLSGFVLRSKQPGVIPTMHFTEQQLLNGFTAPPDTHIFIAVPEGVRIPQITLFGGRDYNENIRYWGVKFTGNEQARKAAGKTGKDIYDGPFFYSLAERKAQSKAPDAPADTDLVGLREGVAPAPQAPASIAEIITEGQYYLMTSEPLYVSVDSDGDDANNYREKLAGTDQNNPDSDGDGITDGIEMIVGKTNPKGPDTDHDGLDDGIEDKNRNGMAEYGESSPKNPDSDNDGLCDGTGTDNGCPEKRETYCKMVENGERVCNVRTVSPVYGEDMNQNGVVDEGETSPVNTNTYGIDDYDYKWNAFHSQNPDSTQKRTPGFTAL